MVDFKQFLEDTHSMVSIEFYPDDRQHFQIYKPSCPDKHAWEIYRNPNAGDYEDAFTECDTLDVAIEIVLENAKHFKKRADAFETASNIVCGECMWAECSSCDTCAVRKTSDYLLGRIGKE